MVPLWLRLPLRLPDSRLAIPTQLAATRLAPLRSRTPRTHAERQSSQQGSRQVLAAARDPTHAATTAALIPTESSRSPFLRRSLRPLRRIRYTGRSTGTARVLEPARLSNRTGHDGQQRAANIVRAVPGNNPASSQFWNPTRRPHQQPLARSRPQPAARYSLQARPAIPALADA